MDGPPWDIETISGLISKLIERRLLGTEESLLFRRRVLSIRERILRSPSNNLNLLFCGSRGEGLDMIDSDIDFMYEDNHVTVLYPGLSNPPEDAHKTVLYVRQSDCRPGYVALQLGHIGHKCDICLYNALVPVGNVKFVSSDMYREQIVNELTTKTRIRQVSNGPSCSIEGLDYVRCFHMNSWPREADQWVTRPRLYGWPTQALRDKIVQNGCHLVPVGDKCSDDTLLQWRISFAPAEILLVRSFSQIHMKTYCLLKYFLKQVKDAVQNIIGEEDDDILCSYHLKTLLFTSLEHTNPKLWQEQNLIYCFWFCFNMLISCVRAGHLPNYFIPTNNMFQRKVHGHNQHKLLNILNRFHSEKLLCLSHTSRLLSGASILGCVYDFETQTELMCTQTVQEIEYRQDMEIKRELERHSLSFHLCAPLVIARSINLQIKSILDQDEVIAFATAVSVISKAARKEVHQALMSGPTNNKTRYRTLKKCQHRLALCASMGTHLLDLATLYFLTGGYMKAQEMCGHVTSQPSYFIHTGTDLPPKQAETYIQQYCGKGYTAIQKLRKTYAGKTHQHVKAMHLPHLSPEIARSPFGVNIPPLPYAGFLSFLCCHELKDRNGCEAALRNLTHVKYDSLQGGREHWIVHTLLGICFQTLGDYPRAISAYRDSAQTKTDGHQFNPALERIAALQRYNTG